MTKEITLIAQFKVHEGKHRVMKELYDEAIEMVKNNEPDTNSFTLFVNDDESIYCSFEVYRNSEGILKNFELAQARITRVLEVADVINCEIYGNVSDEVRQLLTPYGTRFYSYNRGYQS